MKSSDPKSVRIVLLALAACLLALLVGVFWLRENVQPSDADAPADASALEALTTNAPRTMGSAHGDPPGLEAKAQVQDDVNAQAHEGDARAALEGAKPVELLIVDQRLSEPVPEVDVTLLEDGRTDVLRTDADGRCTSTRAFLRGPLSASISDAGTAITSVAWNEAAEVDGRWLIAIPIGPTYPLAINAGPPIDPQQWRARVRETTRARHGAGEIQVEEWQLRMISPIEGLPDRDWTWLDLRSATAVGAPKVPFVRYPRVQWKPEQRYRLSIEVASAIAGRRGVAPIKSTVGRQEPVLVDGLELVSTLAGRIEAADGSAFDARVLLVPNELLASGDHTLMWHELRAGSEFRFDAVQPGAWQLLAFARMRPLIARQVQLTPGLVTLPKPLLFGPRVDVVANVPKTVNTSKARPRWGEAPLHVQARVSAAGKLAQPWFFASKARSEGAGMRIELTQEDLPSDMPADDLELRWIRLLTSGERMRYAATPSLTRIQVPLEAPRPLDGHAWMNLRLFADEPPRGGKDQRRPSEDFELTFEAGGSIVGGLRASELDACQIATHTDVEWSAWRRGSRPCFGTRTSGEPILETKPTSQFGWMDGWGAVLWCRVEPGASGDASAKQLKALGYTGGSDSDEALTKALGSPPLGGVRALADGAPVGGGEHEGASDREGVLRIALDRRPTRLTLIADGWHLTKLVALAPRSPAIVRYVAWFARD